MRGLIMFHGAGILSPDAMAPVACRSLLASGF